MRLLTKNASNKSRALVEKVINKIEGLKKPRKYFMISLIILYLSMRGRYTFKGMERYGDKCEKTYRLQFEQRFDFLSFNLAMSKNHLSNHCVLIFDPCFIPKSGKHTPGKGKFWSGCLGKMAPGIEIGGLAVADVDRNTALILEALQTPLAEDLKQRGKTWIDHYGSMIIDRAAQISALSSYLAVDGYFSKKSFVDQITSQTDLHLICKLRSDANLRYLYKGPKKAGRGRPKKYDGKVNPKKIDKRRFQWVYQDQEVIIYQAELYSWSLKRIINVAYVEFLNHGLPTNRYALYYSTDLALNAKLIYQYYKIRFQIEFLFRDAKQFTGLNHCQARSENKIHFHTNAALTAIGVAKIAHYFSEKHQQTSFSIMDIKTSYFNELLLNLFFSNLQIQPELIKNKTVINKLLNFGTITA